MSDILDEIWKVRHPYDALFLELIDGYYIKESEDFPNHILSYDYPYTTFYIKKNIILIRHNKLVNSTWINDRLIWSVFKSKFSLNHKEISILMSDLLNIHLNFNKTMIGACTSINIDDYNVC